MKNIQFLLLAVLFSGNAIAKGALDDLDYCEGYRDQVNSEAKEIKANYNQVKDAFEKWYANPDSIPNEELELYKAAVKNYLYESWLSDPAVATYIREQKEKDSSFDSEGLFTELVYKSQVKPDAEVKLAQQLFKNSYENKIKSQLLEKQNEIDETIANAKNEVEDNCSKGVGDQIMRATIGRLILTYEGNKAAAKNEKGDIAAFIRQFTGISLTDIAKYGLAGGPNSEMNKLKVSITQGLDNIGIGENHIIRQIGRAIDPTNIKLPKQVQITVDDKSLKNLERNLNPTKWKL